jgi:TolB-like protein
MTCSTRSGPRSPSLRTPSTRLWHRSAVCSATTPSSPLILDLTEEMNQEPFAGGMTAELIDRLSKIPGLRLPAPTSSFYFKGKQTTIADIAKTLGVAYIVDWSVRKSGARLCVAARLIRADNGYVVWSETYDRPLGDILWIQDDIAGEVTKALRASIEAEMSREPSTAYSAATRRCTSKKYTATRTSTMPFTPNTIGAVNIGTSHPDTRFPIGMPPRNAQL